ncbi:MAG: AbrB/MazE/SpoVT family DNA-binding domain-containing protein [Candidatus Baldrarchaeia archaeon]|nr:AbrB/MazE/SpoVT family DNA-binding domain-containing protein [Candidatus Baldrarchaeota archaeon]
MSISKVDSRYRITIPEDIRKIVKVKKGQKVMLIPRGDSITLILLRENLSEALDEFLGDIKLTRDVKKKAEKYVLEQAKEREQ